MRKIILVAAMVLASASAHAGERSLSMSPGTDQPSAPQTTTTTTPATQTSEAATQAPYRPPVVSLSAPAAATAPAVTTAAAPASTIKPAKLTKPARTARVSKPRHVPYWSERRIVAELHRHGFYW